MDLIKKWAGVLATLLCGLVAAFPVYWFFESYPLTQGLLIGGILFFTLPAVYASYTFTPWLPTAGKDLDRIKALASLKEGEILYDLGCGDGRVLTHLSGHTDGLCIGIEYSLFHYLVAKVGQFFCPHKNLQIKWGDLFKEDLSKADVVYVYACPSTLKGRFKEKLQKELKAGARVISYEHPIEGLVPERVDRPEEKALPFYVYVF